MGPAGASFPLREAIELLKSEELSDFALGCGSCAFAVHRLITQRKSRVLRFAMNEDKEYTERTMEIEETTPDALAILILHCYTNTLEISALDDVWPNFKSTDQDSIAYTERDKLLNTYLLADRLSVQNLATEAAATYIEGILEDESCDPLSMIKHCFKRLPKGDSCFIPMLVGEIAVGRWQTAKWVHAESAVRQLAMRAKPVEFKTARYTYMMIRGENTARGKVTWEQALDLGRR